MGNDTNEEGINKHYLDLTFAFDDMVNLRMRNFVSKS